MSINDLCFFYHTGKEKKIVGIVKVIKEYFGDKSDATGNFGSIMVRSYKKFEFPVALKDIKKHRLLMHLSLIKQSRLSVMPASTNKIKAIQLDKLFSSETNARIGSIKIILEIVIKFAA